MQMDLSSDDTIHSLLCDDSAAQNDTQHINCVYHSHLSFYIKFLKFRPFAQILLIKFLFLSSMHRANSIYVFLRHTELCNVLFATSRFLLKSPSVLAESHKNRTKKLIKSRNCVASETGKGTVRVQALYFCCTKLIFTDNTDKYFICYKLKYVISKQDGCKLCSANSNVI